jgi:hypothetical protein
MQGVEVFSNHTPDLMLNILLQFCLVYTIMLRSCTFMMFEDINARCAINIKDPVHKRNLYRNSRLLAFNRLTRSNLVTC